MTSVVTYIEDSGFILSVVTGYIGFSMMHPLDAPTQTIEVDQDVEASLSYVLNGSIVPRPALDLSALDGASTLALPPLSLPAGTAILVDGAECGVSDGTPVEIALPYAGEWYLEFRPQFPYLNASTRVVVS